MSDRILVTGSSGFLGGAIVDRLASRNLDVIGLDPVARPTRCRALQDDLSDGARLRALLAAEKPTHVVHSGGVSGPMVLSGDPARVMAINVTGSLNLIAAALATGVKTLIYCSSVSAMGPYYRDTPIDERVPPDPDTPYACSKAAVEMVLRGLYERVGLDIGVLRFTAIYGPARQTSFVIDDIVAAAADGRAARIPHWTDWPYIFIDDAADAAVAACLSQQRRQLVYYVAYPEQVTLEAIAAAAGLAKLDVDASKPALARGPVDIAAARRDFGFEPKVDHREGVRRMLAARKAGI